MTRAERLEPLKRARVARLLSTVQALREAQNIRADAAAVQALRPTLEDPLNEADVEHWVAGR